jgi:hypothetical protein
MTKEQLNSLQHLEQNVVNTTLVLDRAQVAAAEAERKLASFQKTLLEG